METEEQNDDFQRLHQLISGTEDVKSFLTGMTRYGATTLSRATGARIECAVTLHRRKRSTTIGGSSEAAIRLDGVEQTLGDGPCLESVQTREPVLLPDTESDQRWPALGKKLAAAGARNVLGVPLDLGKDASAALNFFALDTGLFTDEAIEEAVIFADMASQALRLVVRIATADLLAEDRKAAMEHRMAIDVATGIIMAQNQCNHDEALAMLMRASQNRNQKLHDVAEGILRRSSNTQQTASTTHFED
ncbi:GAF domain-containing protein [Paenarthrobacter nicotinovorans]|uniref:GAF and ANTAR domain-containing protein n=1 Tax=Paenarthrobacter nicotinovorans TaxID=29320 RepID=UPI002782AEE6|nr:GAF and ANTAR domain-containing protein [Paenarthrobacter nicotinovorans]MDP9936862.1 GAF domain-containing protein [Paenarthrobacter nicotinovorans]